MSKIYKIVFVLMDVFISVFIPILIIVAMFFLLTSKVEAHELDSFEKTMKATCYTSKEGAITASSAKVRKGICAVKREWMGYTALVWTEDGEWVGIYECLDTGFGADSDGDGIGSIQEGKVIDIYFPTYDECVDFMTLYGGKKLRVQFIWAEG